MYPCKFANCSYEFPTKKALATHVRLHHQPDEVKKPPLSKPEIGEKTMENDMFQMMVTFERLYTALMDEQSKRAKIRRICDLTIANMQISPSLSYGESIARAIEIYNEIEREVSRG